MTLAGIILVISLLVLLFLGVPIAFTMALASICGILLSERIPMLVVDQRMFTAVDSFPLMAIPFFVMAGELMLQGGLSKRLVSFAEAALHGIRGNLALVSIVTCAFFGAISGSALATTAAIGGVMFPEMVKRNYKPDFTATLQATGGTLGILIPPSIPLVIYGVLANTSIGDLFLAVIGGGLVATFLYCLTAYVIVRREGMAPKEEGAEKLPIWKSFRAAFWGLLSPVIILGGIYRGIFTPTESAIAATLYSLFIGIFIYRELNWKNFLTAMKRSVLTTGGIMLIIAGATLFGWLMTVMNIPMIVSSLVIELVDGPILFLLLVNVLYLIAGMFMETSTIILLTTPLMLPVALKLGISPLHFGIVTVVNLSIGLITPPFGASLFVSSSMSGVPIDKIYRRTIPFIIAGIVTVFLVTYIPALSVGFLNLIK
ncbi:MAG: TRAP transporter large permease [Candidatus Adiutrix sp.]|jgi:C4-dicarboxylate transporter DctM subunit|nr:TRAP transporter large permease [Candidatus Adiutrix sp.]